MRSSNKENYNPKSYSVMMSSPPKKRKRSDMTSLEEKLGYTPNSPKKSASADANVFYDIGTLLSKAEEGKGFILDGKNIYWSIAKVLMGDLPYHQRQLESGAAIPAYFNTTMQTVSEEIHNSRVFRRKPDGTAYDHSQKAEIIMRQLIGLYERMRDSDLLFEKNDGGGFQEYEIREIFSEIEKAKGIICVWISIWAPMVLDKLPADIVEQIQIITESESYQGRDTSDISSPLRRADAKVSRSQKRQRLMDPNGGYFVGESLEKNRQRKRQEVDFSSYHQKATELDTNGFKETSLVAKTPKKGFTKPGALERRARSESKNLAVIYNTGSYEIVNAKEAFNEGFSSGSESSFSLGSSISSSGFFSSGSSDAADSLSADGSVDSEDSLNDLRGIFDAAWSS
ncbi:MAG: hypothetical protein VX737_05355 [Pseudomonadota bacterium]|nr:hypothetical protein [Pseudomonadota bacterium]